MKFPVAFIFAVTLSFINLGDSAFAQSTAFTYQGRLNSGGAPASGVYDLQFRLYATNVTGSAVAGPITNNAVAVTNGLFTTAIDFGAVFNGANFWLDIAVRTNGSATFTELAARQLLTPAPFAIYAESAGSLPVLQVQNNTNGAPNLIGGSPVNQIAGGVVGGTIGGGGAVIYNGASFTNIVGADFGTVAGGRGNQTTGQFATISGGRGNVASGFVATIAGGDGNAATLDDTTVSGGWGNSASGLDSVVGGGDQNNAGGHATVVGGGELNFAGGDFSMVGGGSGNNAAGAGDTLVGGFNNSSGGGNNSTIVGGNNNNSSGSGAFIGGGQNNAVSGFFSTISGGLNNTATNDVTVVAGGTNNNSGGFAATIGGGQDNYAPGDWSTVAGGRLNLANGDSATVGGGYGNSAVDSATVAGGRVNTASDYVTTVAGGLGNQAIVYGSAVGGGLNNIASGYMAMIPGGASNVVSGSYAFGAGFQAQATNDNSFVWSDGSNGTGSTTNNQFVARAANGFIFFTSAGTSGVSLAAGSGSWSTMSDRNAKNNFARVNPQMVLNRVAGLPLTTWSYKTEPGVRHVGPMAQDFQAAFSVGENDTTISTVDEGGVALAAIQGLNEKLNEKDEQIQQLQQSVAELKAMVLQLAQEKSK